MMHNLTIRAARQSDKELVLRFCQHTFEWGDYLPVVWDSWISDQSSRLLVGEIDTRPVAIGNVRLAAPNEAWLQGLRIDPEYRGSGLAHSFTVSATRTAAEMGASVVRLMTMPATVAIHKVMDSLGYRRIAQFTTYRADVSLCPAGERRRVLDPSDVDLVLGFLKGSSAFKAMGSLRCSDWVCDELSRAKLLKRLQSREVWVRMSPASTIEALVIVHRSRSENLEIEFADGEQVALMGLALAARREAGDVGVLGVQACLPTVPSIVRAFEAAGFDNEGHEFWIFEKNLSPVTPTDATAN